MNKLPTLEDLNYIREVYDLKTMKLERREEGYLKEDLKQMAIEWVKYYKHNITLFEKKGVHVIEDIFNLTEQDLKETKV